MRLLTAAGTATDLDPAALRALYRVEPGRRLLRASFLASADGAVEHGGVSAGLGGPADREMIGMLRGLCDAILVGAGTLRAERYRPVRPRADRRAARVADGLPEYPRLIVVSGALDLDPAWPVFTDAPVRTVVLTHGGSDPARRDALAPVADVLVHGLDRVDLRAAMTDLRDRYAATHLLCEGGPMLLGVLRAAGLVDELCLTVAPLMAGPGAGRIIAGPAGPEHPDRMRLAHVIEVDGYLMLRYVRVGA